ncbi:ABC transporter permease [Alloalcanivorax profundimaris]|uniref:ABC transporter permease n=1 Tax=Alloalcanivorax profundimaris TaxID=2735259 RepID=UPI001888C6D9|nr:FtsX-like permease family protein [Alloalcanivorax profundimaris]
MFDPRLLMRPWRSGAFRIQALALLVASLAIAAVVLMRGELDHRFANRTAEAIGGDLILEGSQPASDEQVALVADRPHSRMTGFTTVLVRDETFVLVSVKAVDDAYPLFGTLTVADQRFGDQYAVSHGPPAGQVWLAGTALDRLEQNLGEFITVGDRALLVSKVLIREPDQGAGFYSMNPRLMMNRADVASTGILGPGTRVHHELRIAAHGEAMNTVAEALRPTLAVNQEIDTREDAGLRSMGPLRQLTLWGQLAVMMVVLLCGGAVYLAAGVRGAEQARRCAVMKTFGARRRQILSRVLGRELVALLPSLLLGLALAAGAFLALRQWLGDELAWQPPWHTWVLLGLAPVVIWAGFALPRLWRLVHLPAREILGDSPEAPSARAGLNLVGALAAPVLVAMMLSGSLMDLGQLLALMVAVAVGLPLLLWAPLRLADRAGQRWPLAARLALRRLSRRPLTTLPMLAAMVLALSIMSLATQVGQQLLADWRDRLPEQAPNYFVLNLFDEDLDAFRAWLDDHGARVPGYYPVVRGRLTEVNGEPVREAVTKEEDEDDEGQRALNRDLSLTEAERLPESNRTLEGRWLGDGPGEVSVEADLADSLGLEVGDALTFTAQAGDLSATVVGVREVDWESFEPNFYFMFSPGTLDGQSRYWLTSFYLPEDRAGELPALIRQFPQITLLDVNALLDQAQGLIAQASRAALALAVLLLAASVLVMAAAWLAGGQQRRKDEALLRVLGARSALLRRVAVLEQLLLLGGAALFAHLLHLAALVPLGIKMFDGDLPLSAWILLPWVLVVPMLLLEAARPRNQERPLARLAG